MILKEKKRIMKPKRATRNEGNVSHYCNGDLLNPKWAFNYVFWVKTNENFTVGAFWLNKKIPFIPEINFQFYARAESQSYVIRLQLNIKEWR